MRRPQSVVLRIPRISRALRDGPSRDHIPQRIQGSCHFHALSLGINLNCNAHPRQLPLKPLYQIPLFRRAIGSISRSIFLHAHQEGKVPARIVGISFLRASLLAHAIVGGEEGAEWRAGEGLREADYVVEGFNVCLVLAVQFDIEAQ